MKAPADAPTITPELLAQEVEVIFLELLARNPAASAWHSVECREMDVLTALRRRLRTEGLGIDDVIRAAETSPALTTRTTRSQVVDGQFSHRALHCNPRKLPGVTSGAVQADFAQLAKRFNDAGHRPALGLSPTELTLKPVDGLLNSTTTAAQTLEGTLTVRNVGYGSADAIEVRRVICPPWVSASVDGRRITLQANPAFNGWYCGPVTVETTGGQASVTVTSRQWRGPPLTEDRVEGRALATPHAHLDQEGTRQQIEEYLTAAGYRPLAGGFFARDPAPAQDEAPAAVQPATCTWTITAQHLKEIRLPAQGHPPLVRLYSPDGTDRYDVTYDGEALHGEALSDLFLMWDVKAGRELHLAPYRGHYQFDVRRPGTWLHAPAVEYRAVTTLQALNRTPLFWDRIEDWLTAGIPVKLLLHNAENGLLQGLRRRFPARLDLRTTTQAVGEDRLFILSEEGALHVHRLPDGQSLSRGSWPEELWAQAGASVSRQSATPPEHKPATGTDRPTRPSQPALTASSALPPYDIWHGPVAHPLLMGPEKVLLSVKAILEVEGPMVGHHLYARYGQAVQASRTGAAVSPMQLKKALNPLLYRAVQAGQLTAEDEFGAGGQIGLVYRLPGQATRPRQKGDRTLPCIPVSELRAVVATLSLPPKQAQTQELEQVAWVLEQFGFGRFIEGGVERVRPLLRERVWVAESADKSSRRRVH